MEDYKEIKDLLLLLCASPGVSGSEGLAAAAAGKILSEYMPIKTDALGSVIGTIDGAGAHILLDAHLDQIGLIVTCVDDNGFLKVTKCGGADARVLAASEVTVWGSEPLYGVITSTPPHLASKGDDKKAFKIEDISVDTGLSADEAREKIPLGSRITFNGGFSELLNNNICSPCLDDRAGVAAILRCLQLIKGIAHSCKLTVLFSSQEETGGSGAVAGGYSANSDEVIATDVSFAYAPEQKKDKYASLGAGTMIGIAPTLDEGMSKTLTAIAKDKNIPYQVEVMGGKTGTNCDGLQVSRGGVKTALLSIPLRNMHTAAEVACLEDIESTARLMAAYIIERGAKNA